MAAMSASLRSVPVRVPDASGMWPSFSSAFKRSSKSPLRPADDDVRNKRIRHPNNADSVNSGLVSIQSHSPLPFR